MHLCCLSLPVDIFDLSLPVLLTSGNLLGSHVLPRPREDPEQVSSLQTPSFTIRLLNIGLIPGPLLYPCSLPMSAIDPYVYS